MSRLVCIILGGLLLAGCAEGESQPHFNFDKPLTYPLLNTPTYIKLTGDPSGEVNGNFSVLQSKICYKSAYSCLNMAPYDKNATYLLYSIYGKGNLPEYPYTYELRIFTKPNNLIKDALIYSSPRPETGLMGWEIELISTVVKSLSGSLVNVKNLKKCYNIAKDDMREECIVQSFSLGGGKYNITVGFINLEYFPGNPKVPNPRPDLRNFALYIHQK